MDKKPFKEDGFCKKATTTERPDIPEGAKKEAEILFLHQINDLVEENNILPAFIMNFDQTPLKYAPVTSQTLAEKGSKHVGISGMAYRKSLTTTFGITFSNTFLPYDWYVEERPPKVSQESNSQNHFLLVPV